MELKTVNSLKIFTLESFSKRPGTVHFFSSRAGGVSTAPFDALNLSFMTGDRPENVLKNRQLLAEALEIPLENFVFAKQSHSRNIVKVTPEMKGLGARDYQSALDDCDGLISNIRGLCLAVLGADCASILLFDPRKKIIGAVHAGWRGTVGKITQNLVRNFVEKFGSSPADIRAGLGPSIGPCCYEVGLAVVDAVNKNLPEANKLLRKERGKYYFNLWMANYQQLTAAGIPPENIEIAAICTRCRTDLFFSARAAGGPAGRCAAGIMLI